LAIRRGNVQVGIENLQLCLRELHTKRYELLTTMFNVDLVEGLAAVGRLAEASALIDETIRLVEANGDIAYMPELLRVKGRILLSMAQPDAGDPESCFEQSLLLSRGQGARSWELRTAIDLAMLLASQGQADSAKAHLQPVFDQFADGLETADLQRAGHLLASLAQSGSR
jgi:tetratricopeptide (TPR) repeat protein